MNLTENALAKGDFDYTLYSRTGKGKTGKTVSYKPFLLLTAGLPAVKVLPL